MGKPVGTDLREGQVTFPLLAVLPHLSPPERRCVNAVFDPQEPSTSDDIQRIVDVVRERGGIEATRRMAREYADRAREALVGLPSTPAREVMDAAVDYVLARDR
jgi:geranylgeranyl pyrophosphate synthase